ncbi:MAG: hypothetical protein JGK17_15810 [Microcoleus sp. PH2017_10_PVI_O_A]|uniref:hypothetical protein n=1 Tax=unclassified Microcoleus TaxID=2642155 RepID=UPI001DCDEF1E|nr:MULTISPECIES: hypothetical protein [unclassified Microcoleus]TAE84183.1 MAG: hypothetical protein EAZ83_07055 [Oscillatoriales cyanobacterium]MCC3407027.1 hypothetical protein [Microcoleus sp. PH2017_10_PVI_O_A]MCC3459490.1 hypothetical protein [Microcoleus sp. PH2017_11_PCY_U_A]MCC3477927.1 hypothetical protein [Microcoleus sp. PH2017_12_PCY_D_A]MCC3530315.1 hypothetical protein [Microcoleus sp. PH2017_21_RUC_O_A]
MTTTQLALDKKAHPLMMHLSISPKYGISQEQSSYDPTTQTSNISSMSGSWCARSSSTGDIIFRPPTDDDQQEDD